jgi:hypothetical protein
MEGNSKVGDWHDKAKREKRRGKKRERRHIIQK